MPGSGPGMGIPMSEVAKALTGQGNTTSPLLGGVNNEIFSLLSQGLSGISQANGPLSGLLSSIGGLGGLFGTTGGLFNSGAGPGGGASLDKFNGKIIPNSELSGLGQSIKDNAVATRGGSNRSGKCAGLNTAPPDSMNNKINFTIEMLVNYCPSASNLVIPGSITSAYRSPNYNYCVTGPDGTGYNGPHTQFIALDIPYGVISLGEIRSAVRKMHSEGITWGYGEYPGKGFFHIDCRGYWAAWFGSNPMNQLPNVA